MAAELKRQVGIKTRSVKRLAADVKSYLVERDAHATSLERLSSASSTEPHELKRAREFVEEAESTIQDVRQRLQESYHGLENYLNDLEQQGNAEVVGDQCFADARQMLQDVAPLVIVAAAAPEHEFKITVYGGSGLTEDDALWRPTEELGEKLARAGYHVLTGGYSGTSESVSFGASRVSGAKIEGVTCAASSSAVANQYLTSETKCADIVSRAHTLIKSADACIVLPGQLGTLTKLLLTWNVTAIEQLHSRPPPLRLLVWRKPWQAVIEALSESLQLPQQVREAIRYVDTVDEVLNELTEMKQQAKSKPASTSSSSASATA